MLRTPVLEPTRTRSACYGNLISTDRKQLVLAVANEIRVFTVEPLNKFYSVDLGAEVNSLGILRTSTLDWLVVCLQDSTVNLVYYDSKEDSLVAKVKLDLRERPTELRVLATYENSAIISTYSSSLAFVQVKSDKNSTSKLFRGAWSSIKDACFLSSTEIAILDNEPASTQVLKKLRIGRGLSLIDSYPLQDTDIYTRIEKYEDGVLIMAPHTLTKWTDEDGDRVIHESTECINDISVTDHGAYAQIGLDLYSLNPIKRLGRVGSPSRILSLEKNTLLAYGTVNALVSLNDFSVVTFSQSDLGSITSMFERLTPAGRELYVSSQRSESCGITILKPGIAAEFVAAVELTSHRLIQVEDNLVLVSGIDSTLALSIQENRVSSVDSYRFFDFGVETLAASPSFQISTNGVRTSSTFNEMSISHAACDEEHAYVANDKSFKTFDRAGTIQSSKTFDEQIRSVHIINRMPVVCTSNTAHFGEKTFKYDLFCDATINCNSLLVSTPDTLYTFSAEGEVTKVNLGPLYLNGRIAWNDTVFRNMIPVGIKDKLLAAIEVGSLLIGLTRTSLRIYRLQAEQLAKVSSTWFDCSELLVSHSEDILLAGYLQNHSFKVAVLDLELKQKSEFSSEEKLKSICSIAYSAPHQVFMVAGVGMQDEASVRVYQLPSFEVLFQKSDYQSFVNVAAYLNHCFIQLGDAVYFACLPSLQFKKLLTASMITFIDAHEDKLLLSRFNKGFCVYSVQTLEDGTYVLCDSKMQKLPKCLMCVLAQDKFAFGFSVDRMMGIMPVNEKEGEEDTGKTYNSGTTITVCARSESAPSSVYIATADSGIYSLTPLCDPNESADFETAQEALRSRYGMLGKSEFIEWKYFSGLTDKTIKDLTGIPDVVSRLRKHLGSQLVHT